MGSESLITKVPYPNQPSPQSQAPAQEFDIPAAQMRNISIFGAKSGILSFHNQILSFKRDNGTVLFNLPVAKIAVVKHMPNTLTMSVKSIYGGKYSLLLEPVKEYVDNIIIPTTLSSAIGRPTWGAAATLGRGAQGEGIWEHRIKPILEPYMKVVEMKKARKVMVLGVLTLIFPGPVLGAMLFGFVGGILTGNYHNPIDVIIGLLFIAPFIVLYWWMYKLLLFF